MPEAALVAISGYEGPGYGAETPEAREAMELAVELEGLELEVTYTGRTLAALLAAARSGAVQGPVLLWNTFHPRGPRPAGAADWRALPPALHPVFEAR